MDMTGIQWMQFDILERFMTDVFVGVGVPLADAKVCAAVLIAADKRGIDSHGISRLKSFYYDRIKQGVQQAATNFEIVKDGMSTAVVDGHHGMGQVIAERAMGMAITRAEIYGIGMVAVRNSTHYGIAGYYVMQAAAKGMIGISGTNARPSVAPTFGVENMLGTNPLVFGMPTDEEFPFVIDCATSISQRGKIEVYARLGKSLPQGWAINRQGIPVTDANAALEGLTNGTCALTPLGGIGEETAGYKGYGYATVVEILSAALQGGAFLHMLSGIANGKKVPPQLGHFFIAIDVSAFTELKKFKKTTGEILRQLRASKKAPSEGRIYTAGEKEYLAWLERKGKGAPIDEGLRKEIQIMRNELKLGDYGVF
jgi:LDH2 family malate/lactate/ureidoglycolate dehydrogenase